MKILFFLSVLVLALPCHALLSEQVVRTIAGKSGFVVPDKEDVGLENAVEGQVFNYTFVSELVNDQKITIGTLPAGSRILGVTLTFPNPTSDSVDFSLGHAAATPLAENATAFIAGTSFFGGPGTKSIDIDSPALGALYAVALPVQLKAIGNSTAITGEKVIVMVQYVRE